jgi:hypothetical protein
MAAGLSRNSCLTPGADLSSSFLQFRWLIFKINATEHTGSSDVSGHFAHHNLGLAFVTPMFYT